MSSFVIQQLLTFFIIYFFAFPQQHVNAQLTRISTTADNAFNLFHNGNLVLNGDQWQIFYNITLNLSEGDILVAEVMNTNNVSALFVEFQDLWRGKDYSTGIYPWACTYYGENVDFGKPFKFPTVRNFTEWGAGVTITEYTYPQLWKNTTTWISPVGVGSETDRFLCGIVLDYSCLGVSYNNGGVCSGHGSCIAKDTCQCLDGYTGTNCSTIDLCSSSLYKESVICNSGVNNQESKIEKVTSSETNSKNINFENTVISLPSNMQKYLIWVDPTLKNESIRLVSSKSSTQLDNVQTSLATMVMVKDSTNEIIPITNLTTTITFSFKDLKATTTNTSSVNLTCVYFDETEKKWKQDGVSTEIYSYSTKLESDGNWTISFSVNCKTIHLTSFSVIDKNFKNQATTKSTNNITDNQTVLIAAIVSSVGGCCVLCVVLSIIIAVIGICIRRKKKEEEET